MKKIIPFFATLLCVCAVLSAAVFYSFAVTDDSPAVYVIDEARLPIGWSADGASVSKALYTDENLHLSAGEGDDGYLIIKKDSVTPSEPVTATKTFESPINLYGYSSVKLNLSLDAPTFDNDGTDAKNVTYSATVTLYSGEEEHTHTATVSVGKWQELVIPIDDWSYRSRWTGISVSVIASYEGDLTSSILYRLDNVVAQGNADTSFEDTFMTSDFSAAGGACTYISESNSIKFHHSTSASISGVSAYESFDSVSDHNTLRVVLSSDVPTQLSLLLTYTDGGGYISESVNVSSSVPRAFYFSYPNASDVSSFTLSLSSETAGALMIYGIDTYRLPTVGEAVDSEPIGTLDLCTLDSSGCINLRGTVSTDTVVSYLNGELAVYAIPLYADADEYLATASPLVTVDMTTRYNITVEPSQLPEGKAAHRYVVLVKDGATKLAIDSPRLPTPDNRGVSIPIRSRSLKGLAHENVAAGQSVAITELTVDLAELFGDLSSGRIYSAFGKLYYFNSEYLKELDSKIRSLSLSGTDVYVRLVSTVETSDGNVAYTALSADSKDEFETLYTAVDFLTQRYSSSEYGYICGIIAGHDENDLRTVTNPDSVAGSIAKALAVISSVGESNINDFRVLLPFGDTLLSKDGDSLPNELLLRCISRHAEKLGLNRYGVMWQTSSTSSDSVFRVGIDGGDTLKQFFSSLDGTSPTSIFMEYQADLGVGADTARMLYDYVSSYYTSCRSLSVSGFIYKSEADLPPDVWNGFVGYFKLADTDRHTDVEQYVLTHTKNDLASLAESVKTRAHPYVCTDDASAHTKPTDVVGSFLLFGYSDSFDTGGWFSIDSDGECVTVKAATGRAMRSVGGIMYSCAASPIDLSLSSVIAIDATAPSDCEYELILFSDSGVLCSNVKINGNVTVYADISSLAGIDSVTGMMLIPKDDTVSEIYINSISLLSSEKTDRELDEFYASASTDSAEEKQPEENIVTIIAVIFLALIITAAAFLLLRRRDV